ncbi:MAG: dihydropteroate synthase [Tannerellaceae bacterium]|jgi:dihydropteroate synthase|nr:dihydropteroate synthase [Tannerellaceae bacterium]
MTPVNDKTIRIKGDLIPLRPPLVMGILNVTPDSFYVSSRKQTEAEIHHRIETILEEGGRIIDVGGYSSRPGAAEVPEEEEMKRLASALQIILAHYPEAIVSVDTFRAGVARRSVEVYGASLINDISGGGLDAGMFRTVADLNVPYILMHMRGTPQTMQQFTVYDNLIVDIRKYFADKVYELELLGVSDIILDPGFGFSKTPEQNFELMHSLDAFDVFHLPVLAGISRKAMIYKLLDITAEESLNGTTVLNTLAVLKGADILRVHDVKAATEVVRLVETYSNPTLCGCTSE